MSRMLGILLPDRSHTINFTNPFNGRHWLDLLEPDDRWGLVFKRNLRRAKDVLGFTFSSNALGLRGPANRRAKGVILGTSFAMGLSVDDGRNWYEIALDQDEWLNGGMPVGPQNHANLLDDLYEGTHETVIYLYHPNLWKTAKSFVAATKTNQNIFELMRWKTDFASAAALYPKWVFKELGKIFLGYSVYRKWNGRPYFFNAGYNYMDFAANLEFAKGEVGVLNMIFAKFKNVIVIRVPIKEENAARTAPTKQLKRLAANYEEYWEFFRKNIDPRVAVYQLDLNSFDDGDYLPYDTHWSEAGNLKFARELRTILSAHKIAGVR
jgi:hypothetical protein